MTGMINSIKEAFPNFEEDHLDVFSSLNSYQSDAKFHTEESSNAPLPKTSRLSLLPDFFSSSTSASPSHSPMIEKPNYSMGDVTPTDEASCRKIGFKFSADEKQVYVQIADYCFDKTKKTFNINSTIFSVVLTLNISNFTFSEI